MSYRYILYTGHRLVYPVMHQPYFESIFPYLWGSLGCLDLIGGTPQTHCMVLQSRNMADSRQDRSYVNFYIPVTYINISIHFLFILSS